jgi:hypothetical protein
MKRKNTDTLDSHQTKRVQQASEMIVDSGPGDKSLLDQYIDEWKQDEQSQELLSKV